MDLPSIGALAFGLLIGWYVYYINRHRHDDVSLNDLVTLIGILGGAAVTAVFPAGSNLFAGYGIGLAIGFFSYFVILIVLVGISQNFDGDWFLDGRRKDPPTGWGYGPLPMGGAMGGEKVDD
jgi:hypothetical protein